VIATDQYELLREDAGLVDRSSRAKFLVRGGEAADFLQGQVSNDVEALEPGQGCYAAILTHKGKLRTDLRVLRVGARPADPGAPAEGGDASAEDFFWLDTESIGHAVLRHTLETYSLGRDVRFEDVTESHAILSILGPRARDPVEGDAPLAAELASTHGELGLWVRTDLGVDLICETTRVEQARERYQVEEVSEEVAECLRIESGRPRLGFDMDGETIPQEAGINERAVSFTKGCYVGQETVARLHYRGKPNRHLRGLRLGEPAPRGADILLGERVVGRVGSACVSPALGPIALALVRREAAPGDTVLVDGAEAEVVELPFQR